MTADCRWRAARRLAFHWQIEGDLAALRTALFERLVDEASPLRPVAIASPDNVHVLYLHASGMQQTWFFAPFQSHQMRRRPIHA